MVKKREFTGNYAILYLIIILFVFSGVVVVKEGFFGDNLRLSPSKFCGGFDITGKKLPFCDCGDKLFSTGSFEYILSESDPIVGKECDGNGLSIISNNIVLKI